MEIIVVSDTNIFIDLVETGLLDEFFKLPWEIHTTDMIIHELTDLRQKQKVMAYKTNGLLHVKTFDPRDMLSLTKFHAEQRVRANVSLQDCSVWFYAMNEGYQLLTGDAKLRNMASKSGVCVHGIIYVIDKLLENILISTREAIAILEEIKMLNPRLPQPEIERRIKQWKEDLIDECL